jgi:hypothetical protein
MDLVTGCPEPLHRVMMRLRYCGGATLRASRLPSQARIPARGSLETVLPLMSLTQ